MKFEKAVVNRIEVDEEDIITTSGGCTDKTSQQIEKNYERIINCPSVGQQSGNPNCPHGNSKNGHY